MANQEDERTIKFYGWHDGHGYVRCGARCGKRSVFVNGNNALVVDIV
jgi:hypothetical protein